MANPIARQSTVTATILAAGVAGPDKQVAVPSPRLAEVAHRHGGRVVRSSVDGVLAAFDATSPALAAAVDMQVLVSTPEVSVQIGVAAGDVTWEDARVDGPPVEVAASLQAAASGGQILIDDVVRLLAAPQGDDRYEVTGPLDLEGLSGSTGTYGVRWAPPATTDAVEPSPRPLLPLLIRAPSTHRLVGRSDALGIARAVVAPRPIERPDRPHRGRCRVGQDEAGDRVLPARPRRWCCRTPRQLRRRPRRGLSAVGAGRR